MSHISPFQVIRIAFVLDADVQRMIENVCSQ